MKNERAISGVKRVFIYLLINVTREVGVIIAVFDLMTSQKI